MSFATSPGTQVFIPTYLFFVMGCVAQKVYFDCGAKVDVGDVQGLILSPGFPYNYSSGTHCVWQFFVPVNYQLILEIFDFDVFESHDSTVEYAAFGNGEEEATDEDVPFNPGSFMVEETSPTAEGPISQGAGGLAGTPQTSQDGEVQQVVVQEQSTKMEIAKVSNSAKRSADASSSLSSAPSSPLLLPGAVPPGHKGANSVSSSHLREDLNLSPNTHLAVEETILASLHPTDTPEASTESQQSGLDTCPHDVLYISDLITFSSRFCGSNRPPSNQLVFGSNQEMVEVIMELITTTHWGRGFAILFHYHNLTEPGGHKHAFSPTTNKVDSLLAAVSGAAILTMILTSAVCMVFRPNLCPKRSSSCTATNSEAPERIQNTQADVSELQPIADNQTNLEVTAERDSHTGSAAGGVSQNAELKLSSSGLTELDLGADDVFTVLSAPSPSRMPLSSHTQHDRFLRHSDSGSNPAGDWASPERTAAPPGAASAGRPRAWSVRTFQDLIPPIPQLHKKWCSWNSSSPFTKLVDSAPPSLVADCRGGETRKVFSDVYLESKADASPVCDSSGSSASYPLAQPAHRQRRLNSTSNLRRSLFTGPCFGLLSGTADPATGAPRGSSSSPQCQSEGGPPRKKSDFSGEDDHISMPVFAICEEEDRQPLVQAEHLDQDSSCAMLNGPVMGAYERNRPAADSASLSPQGPRTEWRSWGNQASRGVSPQPTGSPTITGLNPAFSDGGDAQLSLSQSAESCSVTKQM